MIYMIRSLLEDINDPPVVIDDGRELPTDEQEQLPMIAQYRNTAINAIKEKYKEFEDIVKEILLNYDKDIHGLVNANSTSSTVQTLHSGSIKSDDVQVPPIYGNSDVLNEFDEEATPEEIDDKYKKDILTSVNGNDTVPDGIDINNHIVNSIKDKCLGTDKCEKNIDLNKCVLFSKAKFDKICAIREKACDMMCKAIDFINSTDKTRDMDAIVRMFISYLVTCKARIASNCVSITEFIASADNIVDPDAAMHESVYKAEDVDQYVSELNKMIPEIRDYYEKFKYKEIIVPRKKHIDKMDDYVRGALKRKYRLKIPIYKVIGISPEVKNIVNNVFIKGLNRIVNKYPNFIVMSPDFSKLSDMFIYITLKEPFGDDDDRNIREMHSDFKEAKNEAINFRSALYLEELPDYAFAFPDERTWPLDNEERIRSAIRYIFFCDVPKIQILADAIARRVAQLGLVGIVKVTRHDPYRRKYPIWILEENNPEARIEGDKINIYLNNKLYATYDVVPNDNVVVTRECAFDIFDENGNLY